MSLETHRALEFAAAAVLGLLPLGLSVTGAGTYSDLAVVTCAVLGAILASLALSGGRDGSSLGGSDHRAADRFLTVVLILAAVVLWIGGDTLPALCCVFAAAVEVALTLMTRYVSRPGSGGPPAVTA
jgi:hypothetical protein